MSVHLSPSDWLTLLTHFLSLSLMAVGGALGTVPEMHRFLVNGRQWLTDEQFITSIALAQAAPGPNILFVALLGWQLGLNAAGSATGWHALSLGLLGMIVCMGGILLPSGVVTYTATRWAHRHRHLRGVRAFKAGMAPVVIALLLATGWLLLSTHNQPARDWRLWLLAAASTLIVWHTRVHLLWLIAAGAVLGMLGWV